MKGVRLGGLDRPDLTVEEGWGMVIARLIDYGQRDEPCEATMEEERDCGIEGRGRMMMMTIICRCRPTNRNWDCVLE